MQNKLLKSFNRSITEFSLFDDYLEVLSEYKNLGILINPKVWFSTEWFCPDGVEGIGVPFYLQSETLMRYLKSIGINVEGETREERKRLFRHELAHVVDNVYGLRRYKKRQALFGQSTTSYPSYFFPKINLSLKRRGFSHLDNFYWQSHPCEDFAETMSFVVESGKMRCHREIDKKIDYIQQLILSSKVFSKQKKRKISKVEVDSILGDSRTIDQYVEDYFYERDITSFQNLFSLKGKYDFDGINLSEMKWAKTKPWVIENFRQIIAYKKNYLGQPTRVSKKTKEMIEFGEKSFFEKFDLNKVFM